MRYATLETVLDEQLRELVLGELHIVRCLPRLIENVSSVELKSQLRKTEEEYQSRSERLERLLKVRDVVLQGSHPRVVDAFMRQGEEIVEHRGNDLLLDHGLVSVLRHLESYQRSLCESAREVAAVLSDDEITAALCRDMEEHGRMERSLTVLEEDMLDAIAARRISIEKVKHEREATAR